MPFLIVHAPSLYLFNDSADGTGKRAHSDDWTAGLVADGYYRMDCWRMN